jgi:hypothetical protein
MIVGKFLIMRDPILRLIGAWSKSQWLLHERNIKIGEKFLVHYITMSRQPLGAAHNHNLADYIQFITEWRALESHEAAGDGTRVCVKEKSLIEFRVFDYGSDL